MIRDTALVAIAVFWLPGSLCGTSELAAQTSQMLTPVSAEESWFDPVPVGGGLRVGVMFETEAGRMDDSFTVWLPEEATGRLCVEISSRDGRYEGNFEYVLSRDAGTQVILSWPSEHFRRLASYPPSEIAILSQLGSDCASPRGPYAVAAWTEPTTATEAVVFLNSDEPSSLVLVVDGLVAQERPCAELSGVTRSFNLRCPLPLSWRDPGGAVFVRILEFSGRRAQPRDLPLPLRQE